MGDSLVADRVTLGPLGVDCVLKIAGRGQDAGVDNEGVAMGLGGMVVMVGVADGPPVCEEDEPAQVVEASPGLS